MFKWRVTVVWRGRCRFTKWQPPGRRLRRRRGREIVPLSPTSRPNCPSLTPATISRHFVCLRVCAVQEWVGASLARLWSVCCASNQIHSLSIHRCTCMHACRRARTHTRKHKAARDILILYSHWSVAAAAAQWIKLWWEISHKVKEQLLITVSLLLFQLVHTFAIYTWVWTRNCDIQKES